MRGWKYHLQNDILTHVKTAMEADESGLLASCGNMKDLVKTFQRRFTPENFFEVFQFVCHYLSLEESTQLAQLYAIDIYMHFCARAKLMADWEPKPPGTPPALTRKFDKIYGTILTLRDIRLTQTRCLFRGGPQDYQRQSTKGSHIQ